VCVSRELVGVAPRKPALNEGINSYCRVSLLLVGRDRIEKTWKTERKLGILCDLSWWRWVTPEAEIPTGDIACIWLEAERDCTINVCQENTTHRMPVLPCYQCLRSHNPWFLVKQASIVSKHNTGCSVHLEPLYFVKIKIGMCFITRRSFKKIVWLKKNKKVQTICRQGVFVFFVCAFFQFYVKIKVIMMSKHQVTEHIFYFYFEIKIKIKTSKTFPGTAVSSNLGRVLCCQNVNLHY